jgi:hypothetical protein
VPASEDRDQQLFDHTVLPDDDLGELGLKHLRRFAEELRGLKVRLRPRDGGAGRG